MARNEYYRVIWAVIAFLFVVAVGGIIESDWIVVLTMAFFLVAVGLNVLSVRRRVRGDRTARRGR